jgi:4-hydroxybenzoate polyprenyltransferase
MDMLVNRKDAVPKADGAPPRVVDVDPPLVVDVDGTLLRTDLLVESMVALLLQRPLDAWKAVPWLWRGKACLKAQLARRVALDIDSLPLDPDVMAFITAEREKGRRIILASASDARFVEALALRIGAEARVFASDGRRNLKAAEKSKALVAAFGVGGFDYVGNSRDDRAVWDNARKSYVVLSGLTNPAQNEHEVIARRKPDLATVASALRLRQWAKNLLLFAPLMLGGATGDAVAVANTALAFLAFGLLASSTYLLNDIVDLTNDRKHPTKRMRALASGDLSPMHGLLLAAAGCLCGLAIGALIHFTVLLALLGYLALTLAYSFWLKRMPIVDGMTLATLYTWRLFTGILTAGVMLSPWLLVFSFAFFLSLSLVKRYTEIANTIAANVTTLMGRGYRVSDGPVVMCLGVAAGMSSVLIFVLYLIEGAFVAAHFDAPEVLWGCPIVLLLWLSRVWLLSSRGELNEDPVEFAVRDRVSLMLGGTGAVQVLIALE